MGNEASQARIAEKTLTAPAELVDLLRSSLGSRYGDPDGWSIDLVCEQGRPGRERRLLRARQSGTGRMLAIKANASQAVNKRQYKALRNLRRKTVECVTPHYIADDARFFAMDWVDAPLLTERLREPERAADLARVGNWLARLHATTARHPLLTRKPYTARKPEEGGGALTVAISERLRARMRLVPYRRGPVAMLHGDLYPGNLFVTDRELLVFDRRLDRYGTPFIDIATFLVSVARLRDLTAKAARPWPDDDEADRRHFFKAYGPIDEKDLAHYDLVEDLIVFGKWRTHLDREGRLWFDDQMRMRGLLEPASRPPRPGRMVAIAPGGACWSQESAPMPRRGGLLRRAART